MTFSQTSACADGCSASRPASDSPAVFSRSLWQVTQYLLMVAAGDAVCAVWAAMAIAAAARTDAIRRYITHMRTGLIAGFVLMAAISTSAASGTPLIDAVKRG